uniref:(California timema) hypothetical protein n=1 Tax=Timema californicum TaxID=61474 RepID=A0A7R9P8J4_TIMCA|nr:unnamed protein product [Timema californicum]
MYMKDNIESLSLLLTTTKDELLKLQKEHTDLLDNIQANEGSSTALQQLNQMNELSIQIKNLHLQHTEKDLEINSLKKILQEKTEKLAETANTIHGLEKNISELDKLLSHWKEKAYVAQNSLLSNSDTLALSVACLSTELKVLGLIPVIAEQSLIGEILTSPPPSTLTMIKGLRANDSTPRALLHIESLAPGLWLNAPLLYYQEKLKLQEDIFNTQEYISSLTMDNQGYKTKIDSLEKCIEELKNTSEEAAEVLNTSLEQTRNENSLLTNQNKDLIIDFKKTAEAEEILKKKISSMQDDLDEVTALEAKIEASQLEQKTLLERCFSSSSTCDSLQRTVNEIRRRLEESQAALHEMGRENQNLQLKLEKLVGRKWTEDSDAARCIKCEKVFTLLIRRHHCRNCFKIYCNECSAKTAAVESDRKPVRVCDSCFNELSSK